MRERVPDRVPDDYMPMSFANEYVHNEWLIRETFFKTSDHCFHCGEQMEIGRSEIRFIIPAEYGGTNSIENLKLICFQCCYDEDNRYWSKQDGNSRFLIVVLFGCLCLLFVRWLFS